jgi:hypothetical protein
MALICFYILIFHFFFSFLSYEKIWDCSGGKENDRKGNVMFNSSVFAIDTVGMFQIWLIHAGSKSYA